SSSGPAVSITMPSSKHALAISAAKSP
ncbi:hypothetical protein D043_4184B, partial [Vibrio parahaemolyticus EKP-021]